MVAAATLTSEGLPGTPEEKAKRVRKVRNRMMAGFGTDQARREIRRIVNSACGSPQGYLVDKMHEIGTMLRKL